MKPRERVVVPGPTACTYCGSDRLAKIGEDVTEKKRLGIELDPDVETLALNGAVYYYDYQDQQVQSAIYTAFGPIGNIVNGHFPYIERHEARQTVGRKQRPGHVLIGLRRRARTLALKQPTALIVRGGPSPVGGHRVARECHLRRRSAERGRARAARAGRGNSAGSPPRAARFDGGRSADRHRAGLNLQRADPDNARHARKHQRDGIERAEDDADTHLPPYEPGQHAVNLRRQHPHGRRVVARQPAVDPLDHVVPVEQHVKGDDRDDDDDWDDHHWSRHHDWYCCQF